MSAPVSQISAAALAIGTEQLALIAALGQRAHDSGASRLGMPAILFEHKGKLLTDQVGSRNPGLAGSTRRQPVAHPIKRNAGRLPFGGCHESNRTRSAHLVTR